MQNSVKTMLLLSAVVLAACDNDSLAPPPVEPEPAPDPVTITFNVTVSNLTNAQPLSPVAVIAHFDGYEVFSVGTPATLGLEVLAEGGDNSDLIAEADGDDNVVTTASGAAPIGPAGSETISVEILERNLDGLRISTSTMLVNTNDAITMANAVDVSGLAAGESISFRTIAYDAGTEANSEEAIHIPGPAGGGEGFNAARDDIADQVAMHVGVVSQDDGFATSDLTGQHRFDNAVAAVRIERVN